uniref:Uncharacterized protein n=1 Tax=Rhizophora mucronata TaxID=61149 RepID=A0A2P2QCY3_RHIMU
MIGCMDLASYRTITRVTLLLCISQKLNGLKPTYVSTTTNNKNSNSPI